MARVLTRVEELGTARPFWEKMQWHPNADFDQYLTLLASRANVVRPHVILLYRDGEPTTALIARVETSRLEFRVGYKPIYRPSVRLLSVMYGGLLGDLSDSACQALATSLMAPLASRDVDAVFMNHVDVTSPLYRLALSIPPLPCRDHVAADNVHWTLSLPPSFAEFSRTRSSNTKENMRRYTKKLVARFGHELTLRCFRDHDDFETLVRDLETVASKTYQRGLGVGFVDNEEMRYLMSRALRRGWLRAYVLYIKDQPCAFWTGHVYGNTFFIGIPGYDPAYSEYRPGQFVFLKMIEELCREGVKMLDFGFGDAQYKRSFADRSWREASIYIFAPTLFGIRLNATRSIAAFADGLGKRIVANVALFARTKQAWRRHVATK